MGDERRLYIAYRDFDTGEGKLIHVSAESLEEPLVICPVATKRLRWNPQIAGTLGGGLFVVWEAGETIYFRAINRSGR
jgi:hypothetical protein